MAQMRTNCALRHKVPAAADETYERDIEVLVWSETHNNNRIDEWIGLFLIKK